MQGMQAMQHFLHPQKKPARTDGPRRAGQSDYKQSLPPTIKPPNVRVGVFIVGVYTLGGGGGLTLEGKN